MKIKKLFENEDVVVVDKPAGLLVHSPKPMVGQVREKTLCDWVLENYPEIEEVGELMGDIKRPGIVHRLDRETSGCLIIVKNQKSFLFLKEQFQNRKIEKIYNCFVWGKMKEEDGVIDREIGKSKKDFRQWSAQRGARGSMRQALTKYEMLKSNDEFSYLKVMPKTGRTHQIRVHMKAINHPVVGDRLYAPKRDFVLGFERLALHAKSIEFELLGGEKIKVESNLPEDFKNALEILGGEVRP